MAYPAKLDVAKKIKIKSKSKSNQNEQCHKEEASNPFEPAENVRFQALNLAHISMLLAITLKDDLSSAVKQAQISDKK